MGVSFSLVKNINLTVNMKFYLDITNDFKVGNIGFNIGAAHLIL
jgi:hypothetical protein